MSYSNFNSLGVTNHFIIDKDAAKNYLHKKSLFVSSTDRDKSKWPNANEFEINCPQNYLNVESIELINIQLPNNLYNISETLQNNKFYLDTTLLTVPDGIYTPQQLAKALEYLLTKNTSATFSVDFNEVTKKFYFKSSSSISEKLNFKKEVVYDCKESIYQRDDEWGLGFSLGFDKEEYGFLEISSNDFSWDSSGGIVNGLITDSDFFGVISPNQANLFGENNIFMEIDKYNNFDELTPFINSSVDGSCVQYNKFYSENSVYTMDNSSKSNKLTYIKNSNYYRNSNFNNTKYDFNGSINTAFATIPVDNLTTNKLLDNKNNNLKYLSLYNPPLERIGKLKFKFRYHDGRLVDFGKQPISFTLEFGEIKSR